MLDLPAQLLVVFFAVSLHAVSDRLHREHLEPVPVLLWVSGGLPELSVELVVRVLRYHWAFLIIRGSLCLCRWICAQWYGL